jgi:hypothetical protein
MLTVDVRARPNIDGVMAHPWVLGKVSTKDITPALGQLRLFNARRKLRAGIQAALAANKFLDLLKKAAAQ